MVTFGTERDRLDSSEDTTNTEYGLKELEEFTEYFVQVYAKTTVSGQLSNIEQAKTLEAGEFLKYLSLLSVCLSI